MDYHDKTDKYRCLNCKHTRHDHYRAGSPYSAYCNGPVDISSCPPNTCEGTMSDWCGCQEYKSPVFSFSLLKFLLGIFGGK